ncbi:MAG: AAA family ATPase [Planctomycetes bacterium]|nr:AAA family ATPase [Planctomycetota bacterium]
MEEIRALQQALGVSPENVHIRMLLAGKLMEREMFQQAEAQYRTGLKISPDERELLIGLSRCYAAQGKHSATLEATAYLLEVGPCGEGMILRARAMAALGRIDDARDVYLDAVAYDSTLVDEQLADLLGGVRQAGTPENTDDPEAIDAFERPSIDFAAVGGMDEVKEAINMRIVHPLRNRELFEAYGKRMGGGVLLYGPPGCGKTLLARATAGEIRSRFYSVGLHDILDMWIGNSEKHLHGVFEQARRCAPCVLFFDEVDALAASRADLRHSGGRNVINQFLSEMDGLSSNEGVLVLAATNTPWYIDSAFRRPGRFDRMIFVPPPDKPARIEIWRLHLENKPTGKIDLDKLAGQTKGFSGADIRAAVDLAVEDALARAMKTGRRELLETRSLAAAAGRIVPSTTEWFATARNYVTYANEGGAYDDIANYLRGGR